MLGAPAPARAWVEAHVLADDARVSIDRDGKARVEHRITLKVGGGPLRTLDVRGVDSDAAPLPDAYVLAERDARSSSLASAIPVALERVEDAPAAHDGAPAIPSLRVRFDTRDVARGTFVVVLRYATDLAARGLLAREGALARIRWDGPIWDDGYESARTIFELPAAPTAPRVDDAPAEAAAGRAPPTFLSTVRRGIEKDEIELVRPYAPLGEAVTWTVRADPRILRAAPAPEAPPESAEAAGRSLGEPLKRGIVLGAGGLLLVLYTALAALKSRQVARHAAGASVDARPLVPLPAYVRAPLAGVALVAGVALEILLTSGTAGALLVGAAAALAAHRTPIWKRPPSALRGPGRWLSIAEGDAFRRPPRPRGAWLDASTRPGKVLLLLSLAVLAGGVVLLDRVSRHHAFLVALDAAALLAIFCTGRLRELPPDPVAGAAPMLEKVASRVRRAAGAASELRVVPRVRVPKGQADADEMRLSVVPKTPLAGFLGIEVGVVHVRGAGGALSLPEVLLRVQAGSECEKAIEAMARHGRSMRGRRPDERVVLFSPRLPTAQMTASIAAALAARVTDRARATGPVAQRRAA